MEIPRRRANWQDWARWTIYLLLSVVSILSGYLILSWNSDIGISLLSGGMTSLLFLIQKIIDDVSENARDREFEATFHAATAQAAEVEVLVRRTAEDVSKIGSKLGGGADDRCIQARHLTGETQEEVNRVRGNQMLEIDAVGISLKQMLADHADIIGTRQLINVRMIVLDPESPLFDASVSQEGRNPATMRNQVLQTIERVKVLEAQRKEAKLPPAVTIRLLSGAMTTTGVRVGQAWYFRPRFQDEANTHRFFFERYDASSPEIYGMVKAHFEAIWDSGRDAFAHG